MSFADELNKLCAKLVNCEYSIFCENKNSKTLTYELNIDNIIERLISEATLISIELEYNIHQYDTLYSLIRHQLFDVKYGYFVDYEFQQKPYIKISRIYTKKLQKMISDIFTKIFNRSIWCTLLFKHMKMTSSKNIILNDLRYKHEYAALDTNIFKTLTFVNIDSETDQLLRTTKYKLNMSIPGENKQIQFNELVGVLFENGN
jgi:hypothetical protein